MNIQCAACGNERTFYLEQTRWSRVTGEGLITREDGEAQIRCYQCYQIIREIPYSEVSSFSRSALKDDLNAKFSNERT